MRIQCEKHGDVEAFAEKQNKNGVLRFRCRQCASERSLTAKRKRKTELVEMLGGKCQGCGYKKTLAGLDFHHFDPTTKKFEIGKYLVRYGRDKLIQEAKKCVLACRNCHAEIESGERECPEPIYS